MVEEEKKDVPTEVPQVSPRLRGTTSLDDDKKDEFADRAIAAMVDFESHKERLGDGVQKNMSVA